MNSVIKEWIDKAEADIRENLPTMQMPKNLYKSAANYAGFYLSYWNTNASITGFDKSPGYKFLVLRVIEDDLVVDPADPVEDLFLKTRRIRH